MNVTSILNQLLQQTSGQQSQSPSNGAGGGMDMNQVINNLSSQLKGSQGMPGGLDLKSLLGGGALGMLVGSKRGRKMGGKALKYGALAGIGVLAWKAYQNYQEGNVQGGTSGQQQLASLPQGQPLEQLQGQAEQQRGLEILQAMIMAARADGHIDADEQALLSQEIEKLGPDAELQAWLKQQFESPLDAAALARQADSPQAAREIYLVSAVIIDDQNPMERAWLDQLSGALQLPKELTQELDRQVLASTQ